MSEISETQLKVMRYIARNATNRTSVQIAGYGRASWLSASGALVRKGLARTWRTGHYALTDDGYALLAALTTTTPEAK